MLAIDQKVRVRETHRLRGVVKATHDGGRAADVLFADHSDETALYLEVELEPDAPCDCIWCNPEANP
jgi:hypothetical protein